MKSIEMSIELEGRITRKQTEEFEIRQVSVEKCTFKYTSSKSNFSYL